MTLKRGAETMLRGTRAADANILYAHRRVFHSVASQTVCGVTVRRQAPHSGNLRSSARQRAASEHQNRNPLV